MRPPSASRCCIVVGQIFSEFPSPGVAPYWRSGSVVESYLLHADTSARCSRGSLILARLASKPAAEIDGTVIAAGLALVPHACHLHDFRIACSARTAERDQIASTTVRYSPGTATTKRRLTFRRPHSRPGIGVRHAFAPIRTASHGPLASFPGGNVHSHGGGSETLVVQGLTAHSK
jgi:hypothetical protein